MTDTPSQNPAGPLAGLNYYDIPKGAQNILNGLFNSLSSQNSPNANTQYFQGILDLVHFSPTLVAQLDHLDSLKWQILYTPGTSMFTVARGGMVNGVNYNPRTIVLGDPGTTDEVITGNIRQLSTAADIVGVLAHEVGHAEDPQNNTLSFQISQNFPFASTGEQLLSEGKAVTNNVVVAQEILENSIMAGQGAMFISTRVFGPNLPFEPEAILSASEMGGSKAVIEGADDYSALITSVNKTNYTQDYFSFALNQASTIIPQSQLSFLNSFVITGATVDNVTFQQANNNTITEMINAKPGQILNSEGDTQYTVNFENYGPILASSTMGGQGHANAPASPDVTAEGELTPNDGAAAVNGANQIGAGNNVTLTASQPGDLLNADGSNETFNGLTSQPTNPTAPPVILIGGANPRGAPPSTNDQFSVSAGSNIIIGSSGSNTFTVNGAAANGKSLVNVIYGAGTKNTYKITNSTVYILTTGSTTPTIAQLANLDVNKLASSLLQVYGAGEAFGDFTVNPPGITGTASGTSFNSVTFIIDPNPTDKIELNDLDFIGGTPNPAIGPLTFLEPGGQTLSAPAGVAGRAGEETGGFQPLIYGLGATGGFGIVTNPPKGDPTGPIPIDLSQFQLSSGALAPPALPNPGKTKGNATLAPDASPLAEPAAGVPAVSPAASPASDPAVPSASGPAASQPDSFTVYTPTQAVPSGFGISTVISDATSYMLAAGLANLELGAGAATGTGNSGANILLGNAGNDTLDGGGGDDTLISGGGDNTYVYRSGYGDLTIDNISGTNDDSQGTLAFDASLTPADITASIGGSDGSDLILTDGVSGDQITVTDAFDPSGEAGLKQILFANGMSYSLAEIAALAAAGVPLGDFGTTGTTGADTLVGGPGPNLFDGKGAPQFETDAEIGTSGEDTFLFNQGYGSLFVQETDQGVAANNTLAFGAGISASNLTVSSDSGGDLFLSVDASDQVELAQELDSGNGASFGVQAVTFANGTTLSYQQLLAMADTGSPNNTQLNGDSGPNILDGKGFAHFASGNGGGDSFIYNQGYGDLTINETDTASQPDNVLAFGPGITASNLTVTADFFGDLILTLDPSDVVTISAALNSGNGITDGVQAVTFANGTTLSYAQLLALADTPSAGNTTLFGDNGPNVLDSKGIATEEVGNGGGDTFLYNRGYGDLTINELDTSATPDNTLLFGSGITPSDVTVTNNGNLILSLDPSDHITLLEAGAALVDGIQAVVFANGTTLTEAQLFDLAATGSPTNTTLMGGPLATIFDSKGFAHSATGEGLGDTFIYNQGYGALTITETVNTNDPVDGPNIIAFGPSIAASAITASFDQNSDLVLTDGVAGDSITITNQPSLAAGDIQGVTFANGASWSSLELLAMAGHGTVSLPDPDSLPPIVIDEAALGPAPITDLVLDTPSAGWTVTVAPNGTDYILSDLGGGQITLVGAATASSLAPEISFSDGVVFTPAELPLLAETGSVNQTTLIGTPGADVIDGKGFATTEIGKGGGDTFIYNAGYGALAIDETDTNSKPDNILLLGAGLTPAELSVAADATGDLILNFGGGDQITLQNARNSGGGVTDGVQKVEFADGTTLTASQLSAMAEIGSPDNTTLFGTAGADLLDGKGFANLAIGGGGGDTFIYNQGYGDLEIAEIDTSSHPDNVLAFGAGIAASDLTVTADASGDLILTLDPNDQIMLDDALNSTAGTSFGVQQVTFANGTSLSYHQLLGLADTPSATNTSLFGDFGPNVFDGKGIATYEQGNGGGDTFIYNSSYGLLTINETDTASSPDNVLAFGSGIAPSSVTVTGDGAGDLILTLDASDQVTLLSALDSGGGITDGVQQVTFANGTTWTFAQLLAMEETPSAGNTSLFGTAGPDVLDSKGIATYEQGNGGGDTFVYNQGYGKLFINETDTSTSPDNVLAFGSGIAPSNVAVTGDVTGDLILTVDSSDAVVLQGALDSGGGVTDGVQKVTFADGMVWSYAQLLSMAETPSATNKNIFGDSGPNILDSKGIATYEQGNGGGDTFIYNHGYGDLTINEIDTSSSPDNVVAFGSGIGASALTVTADASGDLILTLDASDQITLQSALDSIPGLADGVQEVTFANGTSLTQSQLVALADIGSASNTSLYGDAGPNVFDSKGFATYEQGGGGGDTFIYNQGYGHLTINETDTSSSPDDVLAFGSGISASSLTVTADASGDLILTLDASDQITLQNALDNDNGIQDGVGVQEITFADGTSLSYQQLLTMADTGSATNTSLYGDAGPNVFDSKGFATYEQGAGGGDTFIYNQGYGALTINEVDTSAASNAALALDVTSAAAAPDMPGNVLAFGAGINPASVTVSTDASGDIILSDGGSDSVTLTGALLSSANGVQQVTFADAPAWTEAELLALAGHGTVTVPVGFGALNIDEDVPSAAQVSTISIDSAMSSWTVSVGGSGNADLVLTDAGGDSIDIANALTVNRAVAPAVVFEGGAPLSESALLAQADIGSAANSSLFGDVGPNVFDSKGVATYEQGGGGGDSFLYNQGYGDLTINEADTSATPDNIIAFGAGIAASELTVTADASGDLILALDARDQITIQNALDSGDGTVFGVQQITFAGGTSLTYQQLLAMADTGSATNTSLYGDAGPNVFDSKGFATYERGGGGGDTFVYNMGYGALTIDETDTGSAPDDILAFGAGITMSDVAVTRGTGGDVLLDLGDDNVVTLKNQLNAGIATYGIQEITFADGTVWTAADLGAAAQGDVLSGTGMSVTVSANNQTVLVTGTSDTAILTGMGEVVNVTGMAATISSTNVVTVALSGTASSATVDDEFGDTITLSGADESLVDAPLVGQDLISVTGAGDTVTLDAGNNSSGNGSPDTISTSAATAITLTGVSNELLVSGASNTVDVLGTSEGVTVTGNAAVVSLTASGDFLALDGTGDTVDVAGTAVATIAGNGGDATIEGSDYFFGGTRTVTLASGGGGLLTIQNVASVTPAADAITLSASGETIIEASSAVPVDLTGSSDTVSFTGSSDFVTVSGTSDTLTIAGADEMVSASQAVSVILTGAGSSAALLGSNASVSLTASAESFSISGQSESVSAARADTILIAGESSTATIAGNSDAISLTGEIDTLTLNGAGDTLTFDGSGTVTAMSALAVTLAGSGSGGMLVGNSDNVTISGPSDEIELDGSNDVATISGLFDEIEADFPTSITVTSSSDITFITGETNVVSLSGAKETLNIDGDSYLISVTGAGDTIEILGNTETLNIASGLSATVTGQTIFGSHLSDAIVDGSDYFLESDGGSTVTIANGQGATITLEGVASIVPLPGGTTISSSNESVTVSNSSAPVSITGGSDIVFVTGSSDVIAITGASDSLDLSGTGSTVTTSMPAAVTVTGASIAAGLTGNSDTVTIAGTGDSLSLSGMGETVTTTAAATIALAGAGSSAKIAGAGDTVSLAAASEVATLTGANDVVSLDGAGDTVSLSGAGDAASVAAGVSATVIGIGGDAVLGSTDYVFGGSQTIQLGNGMGATITIENVASTMPVAVSGVVTISGSGAVVTVSASSVQIDLTGSSDTLSVTGTSDSVVASGMAETIATASATAITLAASSSASTITGSSDTIAITAGGAALNLSGLNDVVSTSAAAVITLAGSGSSASVSGSGDTLSITGQSAAATLAGSSDQVSITGTADLLSLSGIGDRVTTTVAATIALAGAGSSATIGGAGDTVSLTGAGEVATLSGAGDVVSVVSGVSAVLVGLGGDAIVAGTDYSFGGSQVVTLANGAGATITIENVGSAVPVPVSGIVTVAGSNESVSLPYSGVQIDLLGSSDTLSLTGSSDSVVVSGAADTIATMAGATITLSGSSSAATIAGSGDMVAITGKGDSLVLAGSGDVVATSQAASITLAGASGTATVTGSGDTIAIGVAGASLSLSGTADTVASSVAASIILSGTASSATVTGAGNAVAVLGSSDAVVLTGTSDQVMVSGRAATVSSAAAASITLAASLASALVEGTGQKLVLSGTSDAVSTTGTSDSVTVTGQAASVTTGAAAAIGVTGTGASVALSGSGDAVSLTGSSDVASVTGSGDTVLVAAGGGSVTVSQAAQISITAAGSATTLLGTSATVLVGGSSDTLLLSGVGDTVTGGTATTITVTGTGSSAVLSGTGDTVVLAGTGTAVTASGAGAKITLAGTSNTISTTGTSDAVTVTGAANQVTTSVATGVTLVGSLASAVVSGSGDAIVVSGTSDAVSTTGSSDAITVSGIGAMVTTGVASAVTLNATGASASIGGNSDTIVLSTHSDEVVSASGIGDTISVTGPTGTLVATGTGDVVTVSGGMGMITANSASIGVSVAGQATTIAGTSDTIGLTGTSDTLVVSGIGDVVSDAAAALVSITGTSSTVTVSGTSDTLVLSGSAASVTAKESGAKLSLSGANEAVSVTGSSDSVTITGTGAEVTTSLATAVTLAGSGASATLGGAGDTITLGGTSDQLTTTGTSDTIGITGVAATLSTGVAATVTLSGTGSSALIGGAGDMITASGNSEAVTVTGSADKLGLAGSADLATLSGPSDSATVTGGGAQITAAAASVTVTGSKLTTTIAGTSSTVSLAGSSDTVIVSGVADLVIGGVASVVTLSGTGSTASISGASATIAVTGTSDVATVSGAGAKLSLTGSSDALSVTGSSDSVTITGTGAEVTTSLATAVTLSGSLASATLGGSGDTITLGGTSDQLTTTGTSDTIGITGSAAVISTGPAATVTLSGTASSATIGGTSDTIVASGTSDAVTVAGSKDSLTLAGAGSVASLLGTSDTVTVTAAGVSITTMLAGAISITGSKLATVVSGSSDAVTITGTSDTLTLAGAGDMVGVTSGHSATIIGSGGDASILGIDYVFGGSSTVTVANGTGGTITIKDVASSHMVAGTGITTIISQPVDQPLQATPAMPAGPSAPLLQLTHAMASFTAGQAAPGPMLIPPPPDSALSTITGNHLS
jgi:Haemolysin-type calcium binding protein related domain/RTX calcium-binding nonapeptide repeat (4 copies)